MPEKKIILLGGGGHCRSCIDVIEKNGLYTIAGIVEKPSGDNREFLLGYPVLGDDSDLAGLKKRYDHAMVTVGQMGSSHIRVRLYHTLKKLGFLLPVVVSSLAYVSKHASIGEGTIVMHKAIVNAKARIGSNCILNTGCIVEHDAVVGNATHISTAAVINGGAVVGSGSFVGSGTTVVNGIKLPDDYFFKAGSIVSSGTNGKQIKEGQS